MRFTLLLISIFFYLSLFSQKVRLTAKISNTEQSCDSELKDFYLFKSVAVQDSVVFKSQSESCVFDEEIELQPGVYIFRVKSLTSEMFDTKITIESSSVKLIEVPEIKLKTKTSEIEEVTITGVPKKFIQIDPEKTIITVENNAILEQSSIYDAINKIPGIIPNPSGGFTYSGQQASVFFEGIPSTVNGVDLDNLLRSLPATSVKKIELVTNPGASYDANFSGAIIDIISHDKSFKWLSGSVSLNVGVNQNLKVLPTFLLNGKAKRFTWNVQSSYSYRESTLKTSNERNYTIIDSLLDLNSKRDELYTDRYFSVRGNIMTKLSKKSILQLNAGFNNYNNQNEGFTSSSSSSSLILPYTTDYLSKGKGFYTNAGLKYRVYFDSLNRKLEFTSNFSYGDYSSRRNVEERESVSNFSMIKSTNITNQLTNRLDLEFPLKNKTTQFNFGLKSSIFNSENTGSYRLNDTVSNDWESVSFSSSLPFAFKEQNSAVYTEYKQRIKKKWAITLGLRAEDFRVKGKVESATIVDRTFLNVYPSIHALYRVSSDMIITMSYSRKINMPSSSMYDPNLSGYYDSYTQSTGSNLLDPNFLHRSHLKLSIFEYLQMSFSHTFSNSINFAEAIVDSSTYSVNYTYKTYSNVQSISGFFSLPVPFGVFSQGLDFFRNPVDIDAISFMYLYTDFDKYIIPGYNFINGNKTMWSFGVYSQFILPLKVRLNVEYNVSGRGMQQINEYTKVIHDLEAVLSREFKEDKWRVSLSVQDILNTNRNVNRIVYNPLTVQTNSKADTRIMWVKVAYSFGKYERPSLKEDAIPEGKSGN
jgi:iron complex outermembrane recepter protein